MFKLKHECYKHSWKSEVIANLAAFLITAETIKSWPTKDKNYKGKWTVPMKQNHLRPIPTRCKKIHDPKQNFYFYKALEEPHHYPSSDITILARLHYKKVKYTEYSDFDNILFVYFVTDFTYCLVLQSNWMWNSGCLMQCVLYLLVVVI